MSFVQRFILFAFDPRQDVYVSTKRKSTILKMKEIKFFQEIIIEIFESTVRFILSVVY